MAKSKQKGLTSDGKVEWPYWAYPNKRAWLRSVRKRWAALKKAYHAARSGCAYYPPGTMDVHAFHEADKKMQEFYKNA